MIRLKRIEQICSQFREKKILIFGDIILDRYIFGKVNRISPEAPVPVIKVEQEEFRLGGAANVASNVDKLGAGGLLLGISGDDLFAAVLDNLKSNGNHILKSDANKTLVKTRVISQRQQIVRIDREEPVVITPTIEKQLKQEILDIPADGIIVSDYAKGTLSPALMQALIQKASSAQIPIVVDPKPPNFDMYRGVDGITPNLSEARSISNKLIRDDNEAAAAVRSIRNKFKSRFAIVTRGDRGITASEKGKQVFHLPAFSHEVYDVTGAGDTVVSVLVLALISGATLREAVALSNAAASIVVEKIGTSQVSVEELQQRMKFLVQNHKW